jgi:4-amino-4-deoxy-L-arabinose transferase-like glycosyltransferase
MATNKAFSFLKRNRTLILILLTSLVLRILFSIDNIKALFIDISDYDNFARHIVEYGKYPASTYHPPVYPYFIAGIYSLFGFSYLSVYVVQSILGVFNTLFIFLIGKNIFNSRIGKLSAVASLLYWPLTMYSGILMSETVFLFLLLLGIYLLLKGIDTGKAAYFAFCGTSIALSTPTRSINLLFIILIPIGYCVLNIKNIRTAVRNSVIFMLLFCVIMSPWVIRNYKLYNAFIPVDSLGGVNLYIGNNEKSLGFFVDISHDPLDNTGKNDHESDQILKKAAVNYILNHPLRFAALTVWRSTLFIIFDFVQIDWVLAVYMSNNFLFKFIIWYVLVYLSCAFFFILGVKGLRYLWKDKKGILLLCIMLYYLGVNSVFYIQARYRLPVMPFLSVAAAFSLDKLITAAKKRFHIFRGKASCNYKI